MSKPNIVLIVLDAVRHDHVSWHGYERNTTPVFDTIAENGVAYRYAFSPSIWTPTVHASIFTGEYPSHNGVYTGGLSLPREQQVLPELLSDVGYQTFATSSGAHLRRDRGYARGFDEYVESPRIKPTQEFLRQFLKDASYRKQVRYSLTRGPDDKTVHKFNRMGKFVSNNNTPFFCFINCKTAHQPWNPPRPYKSMYTPGFSRPQFEFIERLLKAAGRDGISLEGYDIQRIRRVQDSYPVLADEMELTEDEWGIIESWYDGAIRYLDSRVGSFIEYLKSIGEFDDTLFVVTSDHGDHFGDHGLSSHLFSVHDTLLHVPMAISPPAGEFNPGTVIDSQVTLVDLYKTFLDTAGIESTEYPLTTSLKPYTDRKYHEYTFAEYAYPSRSLNTMSNNHPEFEPEKSGFDRSLRAVRDDRFKLILGSNGERALYRWREDPRESDDIAGEYPDVVNHLENTVDDELGTLKKRAESDEQVTADVKERLEQLGYR